MRLVLSILIIALIALAVVSMWPSGGIVEQSAAPTAPMITTVLQTSGPATPAPLPVASPEAQRAAVTAFPELADANSALNREFVRRYEAYTKSDLGFFADPQWP